MKKVGMIGAALMAALCANAVNIPLMGGSLNDGDFESVFTGTGTVNVDGSSSTNMGSVWTYTNTSTNNACGWFNNTNVIPYNDHNDTTNTVTSVDILGTGGYTTVTAGDKYGWSFDVFARSNAGNQGTNSFGSLSLSFDGGSTWVLLGTLVDDDLENDFDTLSGVYTVTSQDATDAASFGIKVQGSFADVTDAGGNTANIRYDNVVLTVLGPESVVSLTPSDLLSLELIHPETVKTGTVEVAFEFGYESNTVEISSASVINQQHPGAFSVVDFPASLVDPSPSNGVVSVEFDNSVAGLADQQTSTGVVQIIWNEAGDTVDYTNTVPVSALFKQPVFSWSAQFLTDPAADVSVNGFLLEALNFNGGTNAVDYDTTLNGVTFNGLVSGASGSTTWNNPSATYFSADSSRVIRDTDDNYNAADGGIAAYDVLLSRFIWGGNGDNTGGNTVTLKNLTVGKSYEVQLFFGDTSSTTADRWIIINDGLVSAFGADGDTNHKAPTGEAGRAGVVITGEFTATETNESFTITQYQNGTPPTVVGNPMHLNAYQLRSQEAASAAVIAIGSGSGSSLSISSSNMTAAATYKLQGTANLVFTNWYDIATTSGVSVADWIDVIVTTNEASFFRVISE